MDLIKSIFATLVGIIIVAFGLTIGFLFSVAVSVMSVLAMIGTMVAVVAYAIYDAIRSPSP